jgi:hypothetical protein
MEVLTETLTTEAAVDRRRGWIHSPAFDLALLTLSPLSGVVLLLLSAQAGWGRYVPVLAVAFVAAPHYLSTFTFFFDDTNLAYYRRRWMAFFAGPLVCASVVAVAIIADAASLFQAGVFSWNLYHVTLQSSGILGIYRALNGGNSAERPLAITALLASAGAMVLARIERYPPVFNLLSGVSGRLPGLLFAVAVLIAVPTVLMVINRMIRRRAARPEALFFVTSLLLFHPYLWVEDSERATLAMLMGHFVQYLTIVWLVHRRKHTGAHGSIRQRGLGYISGRTTATLGTFAMVGLAIVVLDRVSQRLGVGSVYLLGWNVLVLMHFYLDGVIWSFRHREIRESIGAYLVLPAHRRS